MYSLIQIQQETNGFIDGVWIQDHTGTLDTAIKTAKETERVNGNKIKIAVVEKINGSSPNYCLLTNLKRLE
jgi:hypothetical protein